ncbi:MAG: gluconate 2-dehydrogenase subunit 3 family protein [Saprospiraceae bacterium]|nr:gluconate 2-dehydrogenase subunit 3 family protein [Saprospiraceae bacterium]
MNRRELLKHIAVLTGASVVGADFFLTGCAPDGKDIGLFSAADVALLDHIAETIIPRTATPGARDAQTGAFIADFVTHCYDDDEQKALITGLAALTAAAKTQHNRAFGKLKPTEQLEVLSKIAAEAKVYNEQQIGDFTPHYFTLLQQLTLLGFFTSEQGYTQVLRYEMIPGPYKGCIDYKKGEKAWAN